MDGIQQSEQGASKDLQYLPDSLRARVQDKLGTHVTMKDIIHSDTAFAIERELEATLREDTTTQTIEDYATILVLNRIGDVSGVKDYSPRELASKLTEDCGSFSQLLQARLARIYSSDNGSRYQVSEQSNPLFYSIADDPDDVEVQHMAYFQLSDGTAATSYLVDVAALFFNDKVFSKAFNGASKDDVLEQGQQWLSTSASTDTNKIEWEL